MSIGGYYLGQVIWSVIGVGTIGVLLYLSFFTVEQQTVAVVERFGRFLRTAGPGLHVKIPFVDQVAGDESLRVEQLDLKVETKTADNVFVHARVAVQYAVQATKVYEAFYILDDPTKQIASYVFDVVRARVPQITLDDVFEKKEEVASAIEGALAETMSAFGFSITKALVTDIEPDGNVKAAMNEINAAQRLRVAATEKGEADRILKVKAAEAEAQSKALQGRGIADQRKAIVEGLRESVGQFQASVPGASAQDVMTLVLMTQYFDTLKEVGAASTTNTILIPHSPGALADISAQIRNAMLTAGLVAGAGEAT